MVSSKSELQQPCEDKTNKHTESQQMVTHSRNHTDLWNKYTLWTRAVHHLCIHSWKDILLDEPNIGTLYFPSLGTEAVYLEDTHNVLSWLYDNYSTHICTYVELKCGLSTSRVSSGSIDQICAPSLELRIRYPSTTISCNVHLSSSQFAQSNIDNNSWIANAQQSCPINTVRSASF